MQAFLAHHRAHLATSGTHLALLAVGGHFDSRTGWTVCLSLMVLLSLAAWTMALRRRRAIVDTPTSRIAYAAQGYVELQGRGRALDGLPLVSPLSGVTCLWYRYLTERRDGEGKWVYEDSGESDASFLLEDETGSCLVDPEGAEVSSDHKECWTAQDRRLTEWRLLGNDKICVLGDFATLRGGDALDSGEDTKQLLAEWKRDPVGLRRRFDLNGDGEISEAEWQLARSAARREVEKRHTELMASPDLNTVRRPAGGQAYLISNLTPERLARRFGLWAVFHLVVFFAVLGAFPRVLAHYG